MEANTVQQGKARKRHVNKRFRLLTLDPIEEMITELLRQLPSTTEDYFLFDTPDFPEHFHEKKSKGKISFLIFSNFANSVLSTISTEHKQKKSYGNKNSTSVEYSADLKLFNDIVYSKSSYVTVHHFASSNNFNDTDIIASILDPLNREECSLSSFQEVENNQFQDQVISGSLPCPKEEAAYLASIQLCVEEQWPSNKRTQTIRRHLLKGQFEYLKNSLGCGRYRAPFANTYFTQMYNKHGWINVGGGKLYILALEMQAQCLPVDLRGDRRTIKLVKERKRKLFHSQVYESEIGMKKLYIQTAKKLAAFGCKVFQVKELLHGRTLRKTLRLLCLSSASLCLLDGSTKLILKRQHASTLQQWRVGGGVSKHQLLLEFRGTKWQLIAPSYNALKSISMTLWEIMQNSASSSIQRSLNQSMHRSQTEATVSNLADPEKNIQCVSLYAKVLPNKADQASVLLFLKSFVILRSGCLQLVNCLFFSSFYAVLQSGIVACNIKRYYMKK
uniref:B41 domain-containing protein n=1 Tax=Heterorhabditis bacteriophora TaxID=37862 RepID=A0A1I7WZW3_HETBA